MIAPDERPVSGRAPFRLASALALVALGIEGASLFVLTRNAAAFDISALGFNGVAGIVIGVTYPIVGWVIASRRPSNWIGWIFLIVSLSQAGSGLFGQYALYGLLTSPGSLPGADLASWAGGWIWAPGFAGLFIMLMFFPSGSLPSPRWRAILAAGIGAAGVIVIATSVGTWGYRGPALVGDNNWPDAGPDPVLGFALTIVSLALIVLNLVGLAAIASLFVRFRRADLIERQQIKWFVAAAAIEVALVLLSTSIAFPRPLDLLAAIVVIPLVPIATVVAILRYRLYEIDRIISRTIAWAVTTGVIVAVFAGIVVGLQGALAQVTGGSTVAVAGSTLVAAAIAQPLRRRVQAGVDRRFNRARFDAQRTVEAFAARVRDEVDLPTLRAALASSTNLAVHPASTTVWLRNVAEPPRPPSS